MASATPSESVESELRCSICLDTFVCPSTLSCGHSFCLRCLEAAWETASSFSCPQCRATFPVRPQLRRNVVLANLAEQLRVGDGMATVVVCDICGDGQTPAVKTCLRCEMSYCFSHYKPHLANPRLRDHAIVDPTASLDERRCPEHSEELKFYCTVDSSLVCSTCTIAGEHKGHKVLTLKKEHETRKTRVEEETRAVEEKRKEAEESEKRMEAARKEAQESVAGIRGRITGKFARLRKALDEDEKEALQRMAVKERELLSRIDEDIARHKREIGELQATAARLRTLQHERDSLAFLQGHLEETRRREIPKESAPPPPTSLDATTIRSLERAMPRLLPLVSSSGARNIRAKFEILVKAKEEEDQRGTQEGRERRRARNHEEREGVARQEEGAMAVAIYDYQAVGNDEISFDPGDIITNIECLDVGWWRGECNGQVGIFPANYVHLRQ